MHIIMVDLTAPGISFAVTPQSGTRDTTRQTTLDYLNQTQAQVAINAHFFAPFPSTDLNTNLVGLAASAGNVYSPFEPQPIVPGDLTHFPDQSYAILPYAPALNIDATNHATVVHRDAAYADGKHILESTTLYNAVSGCAQIVTNGVVTIPTYSGVASGGLNPLNGYSDSNSWYNLKNARTVIGLSEDSKTLVLFTVDAAGGSAGMTPAAVADLLISDYGVWNAIALDGGGSTTLAIFAQPGPEPATLALVAGGLLVALWKRRARRG